MINGLEEQVKHFHSALGIVFLFKTVSTFVSFTAEAGGRSAARSVWGTLRQKTVLCLVWFPDSLPLLSESGMWSPRICLSVIRCAVTWKRLPVADTEQRYTWDIILSLHSRMMPSHAVEFISQKIQTAHKVYTASSNHLSCHTIHAAYCLTFSVNFKVKQYLILD